MLTPPSRWSKEWLERLSAAPSRTPAEVLAVHRGDSVLAVVAHPDDETLAMGASLAELASDGVAVHLLVMTMGEAALDHVGRRVPGLAERRRHELERASDVLGIVSVTMAGLPDTALSRRAPAIESAVREACDVSGACRIATLSRKDPHPDHQAVARAAAQAASAIPAELGRADTRVHEFALWTAHWTDPASVDDVVALRSTPSALDAKQAALACYTSQTEPLAADLGPVLPAEVASFPREFLVQP